MTHKTIDISEDVYKKITDLKQKDESISNFILRLINEKKKKKILNENIKDKSKNLKKKEESISNFILRIKNEKKKKEILNEDLEGNSEDWEKIEKILYEDRLKSNVSRDIEL